MVRNIDSTLPPVTNNHTHSTWARTFHSRPSHYYRPTSLQEVSQICAYARRTRKRIVVTGAAHSPSDLTCTSSILIRLDRLDRILSVEKSPDGSDARVFCQAGISLHELSERLSKSDGLIIPNLGSIDAQSIAGALATGTHGSSLYHGLLSQEVYSLRICLADGNVVRCSPSERPDLFKAASVSLGALGVVVEVELRMVQTCNVEWQTELVPVRQIVNNWNKDHWSRAEFTRCWWLPYQRNMIVWRADKTEKPLRAPPSGWLTGGLLGFWAYKVMLWVSHYVPRLLPMVEYLSFGLSGRFSPGPMGSAVEEQRNGLLMDCGFSQLVNEWAVPLSKGPEAIDRLEKWLLHDLEGSGIPVDPKGVYVHQPVEVRVTDNSTAKTAVRGYLDPSMPNEPTLYINATLYRPFGLDPPCTKRYYEAFEFLMKQLGGRPHWAKNFMTVRREEFREMYGEDMKQWLKTRSSVDPEGVFVGAWHRRNVLGDETPLLPCEEGEDGRKPLWTGGWRWWGATGNASSKSVFVEKETGLESEESFDSFAASTSTESEGVISLGEDHINGR